MLAATEPTSAPASTPAIVSTRVTEKCTWYQSHNVDGKCITEPRMVAYAVALAPVLVPLVVADGLVGGTPPSKWLDAGIPRPISGLLPINGWDAIPALVIGGALSLFLWYKIYGALTSKGGS